MCVSYKTVEELKNVSGVNVDFFLLFRNSNGMARHFCRMT